MRRIAEGDADAFEEIYRRHIRQALMQARKLCASRELAEEVAQETFISLWRSAHRYRPSLGSVGAWLSSMVRNRAIDAWRRAAVRPTEVPSCEHGPDQLHTAIGADTPPPERALVLSLLATLPAGQKEAVFLAYFGGMTHAEIAAWADEPLGTIKGRIRLGLEKLRAALDELGEVPAVEPARPVLQPAAAARPAFVPELERLRELEPIRRRRAGAVASPRRLVTASAA
jgi:RNA polymerase sigma-70 factor (ECF subfamily)